MYTKHSAGPSGSAACSTSSEFELFTLNIGGPSLARASRLAHYLRAQDYDVIALTETRPTPGTTALADELRESGYKVLLPWPPSHGERGVALLSRSEMSVSCNTVDWGHRLVVETLILPLPVSVIAAYVPSRDASPQKIARKQSFLAKLVEVLSEPRFQEQTIVMGDFNVVGRDHTPRYSAFRAWEYGALERIAELGFVDVFASLHPGIQAHSWIGRSGDGYRYDYVFTTPDLAGSALGCEYVHEVREEHLSDHAGVLLRLESQPARKARSERYEVAAR